MSNFYKAINYASSLFNFMKSQKKYHSDAKNIYFSIKINPQRNSNNYTRVVGSA